jgi:hypothetical protein
MKIKAALFASALMLVSTAAFADVVTLNFSGDFGTGGAVSGPVTGIVSYETVGGIKSFDGSRAEFGNAASITWTVGGATHTEQATDVVTDIDSNSFFIGTDNAAIDFFNFPGLVPLGLPNAEDLLSGNKTFFVDLVEAESVTFQIAPVPEISSWVMSLIGFAGLGFVVSRKNSKMLRTAA